MGLVKVHVLYCGGWGYGRKVDVFAAQLNDEYDSDELVFSSESIPGRSGQFEVTVNGELVHSKKEGSGFIDSEQKLKSIFSAIDKALD